MATPGTGSGERRVCGAVDGVAVARAGLWSHEERPVSKEAARGRRPARGGASLGALP